MALQRQNKAKKQTKQKQSCKLIRHNYPSVQNEPQGGAISIYCKVHRTVEGMVLILWAVNEHVAHLLSPALAT